MAARETNLDKSDFYQTALDTLMDTLHISSTPNLESAHSKNKFQRHFYKVDEEKFFSFCSTIKRPPKSGPPSVKDTQTNSKNTNNTPTTSSYTLNRDTPKRKVTTTRKQKLFENSEGAVEEKEIDFQLKTRPVKVHKELSPKSLQLKKAILRLECLERQQRKAALTKKSTRTSLRI